MIVYTVGTFDRLHVGHLRLLEHSQKLGSVVAAGVASDRVVHSYRPNKPVIPLEHRMQMLCALRFVDIVILDYELEYGSGCRTVAADIFVVGEAWGKKAHNLAVEAYFMDQGSGIVKVQYDLRTSSTQIKQTVKAQPARTLAVAV